MLTKSVIFDLEGVIIDTQPHWTRTTADLLAARGLPYDRERLLPLMAGNSLPQGTSALKREMELGDDLDALVAERLRRMTAALADGAQFIQGFEAFFDAHAAGRQVAIATSMHRRLLEPVRGALALESRFGRHIYDVSMVDNRGKPFPDLFQLAAQKLGAAPQDCTVIEDAPNGIEAARAAGMQVIAIATTFAAERLSAADLVVRDFTEIPTA